MARTVPTTRAQAKSADFPIRNQNDQIRNQISPVMARVRELLPQHKSAHHLSILLDEPLGNCQKLLCGARTENAAQLAKLLRSSLGREVLFALMGDARPDWFSRYQKQLDLNAARKQLLESQRALEAMQQGLIE
jgi:hypothetical protein